VRIEDAFIYVMLDLDNLSVAEGSEFCIEAVAGGADVIELNFHGDSASAGLEKTTASLVEICHREESLCVVKGCPDLAAGIDADGIRLDEHDQGIGLARAVMGDRLVGMSSRSKDDAILALEVGADFLLHFAGREGVRDFAGFGSTAGVPLFAAGLQGPEDAERIVGGGVYRFCVESSVLKSENVREQVSGYSRLIGRTM
jgi:thiamine monophosphate synthase